MPIGKSQFTGAAGTFWLAYQLSLQNISASITVGNAPSVDVVAVSSDGKCTLSFQVKTANNAYRKNRYKSGPGYEWDVGRSAAGKHSPTLWYALVDLKGREGVPDVYVVPSKWVAEFVKADWPRHPFYLPKAVADELRDNWTNVHEYFEKPEQTEKWATSWHNGLTRWGKASVK